MAAMTRDIRGGSLVGCKLLVRNVKRAKRNEAESKDKLPEVPENRTLRQKYTIDIFLSCLRIIFHRDTFLTL